MSVTGISKDAEALTMTVTAEYEVAAERAWQLWADPRQLERWGTAGLPGDRGGARPAAGRSGRLLHDRAGGGDLSRLVDCARGAGAAAVGGRGRLPYEGESPNLEPAGRKIVDRQQSNDALFQAVFPQAGVRLDAGPVDQDVGRRHPW